MAVETADLTSLLDTIGNALTSSQAAFPDEASTLIPPSDGISLLDVKNDLLLSYLHHLVFLIALRLQHASEPVANHSDLNKKVVSKLIELRAYLDRGIRPLESKLRYQIDKVLRAADDSDRNAAHGAPTDGTNRKKKTPSKRATVANEDASDSDVSRTGSPATDSEAPDDSDDDELHTAPRLALLASAAAQKTHSSPATATNTTQSSKPGIYRPPRIAPTSMPTTSTSHRDLDGPRSTRRHKNALLDEYLAEEHSTAPSAQPSIGANNTITARGRSQTAGAATDAQRRRERERIAYEEANYTRLPAPSKQERRRDRAAQLRRGRDMFGGEDWAGLGGLGDRIGRSVSGGAGGAGVLERREKRKRERETVDLPRRDGGGQGMGESFEKKRRMLLDRERRKGRR